jgi:cell division protein ZapA
VVKAIDVEIAGMTLRLKSSHDEATVHDLVRYVDHRIQEALPLTKNASLQTAALLACLNIAEELILLKRKAQAELNRVESKAQRILQHLENSQTSRSVELSEVALAAPSSSPHA